MDGHVKERLGIVTYVQNVITSFFVETGCKIDGNFFGNQRQAFITTTAMSLWIFDLDFF